MPSLPLEASMKAGQAFVGARITYAATMARICLSFKGSLELKGGKYASPLSPQDLMN